MQQAIEAIKKLGQEHRMKQRRLENDDYEDEDEHRKLRKEANELRKEIQRKAAELDRDALSDDEWDTVSKVLADALSTGA